MLNKYYMLQNKMPANITGIFIINDLIKLEIDSHSKIPDGFAAEKTIHWPRRI
jgi:hypothetical protein